MLSAVLLVWVSMAILSERVTSRLDLVRPYSGPEIHIFGMLGVFEVCIRIRLMPHNENYAGFFRSMHIPVLITDLAFRPVFETAEPLSADRSELGRSLSEAAYPAEDIRLNGKAIRAGFVFWTTDERELRRMNDFLLDGKTYTQIVSSDVTALYRVTEELSAKNERLRNIQIRMKAYQA